MSFVLRHLPIVLALASSACTQLPTANTQGGIASTYDFPTEGSISASDAWTLSDIIARMNGAIDTEDYPLYASFYTVDGVIDSGFGPPVIGRDAIVESLEASAAFITNKRHVASNIVLNRLEDRLVATYYLTVFERRADLSLAGTALIVDEFRRDENAWRVVRHTTRMDPATLAAMQTAGR